METLEKLSWIIAEEMVACVDSRLTRAFDRLMAADELDTAVFAIEEAGKDSLQLIPKVHSARA